jgi:hypothetical protein
MLSRNAAASAAAARPFRLAIRTMGIIRSPTRVLVPAKPTASGRVTQKASSDPACFSHFGQGHGGRSDDSGSARDSSSWEKTLSIAGKEPGLLETHAPNGGYLTWTAPSEGHPNASAFGRGRLLPRRRVVSSSRLITNSRDAGILFIQLRCNSLRRVPERWPARPVYPPARRVGASVRMAAAAELRAL